MVAGSALSPCPPIATLPPEKGTSVTASSFWDGSTTRPPRRIKSKGIVVSGWGRGGGRQTKPEGRVPAWSPWSNFRTAEANRPRSVPVELAIRARRLVLQPLQCIRHHAAEHRAQHRNRDQARRKADHKRGLTS